MAGKLLLSAQSISFQHSHQTIASLGTIPQEDQLSQVVAWSQQSEQWGLSSNYLCFKHVLL